MDDTARMCGAELVASPAVVTADAALAHGRRVGAKWPPCGRTVVNLISGLGECLGPGSEEGLEQKTGLVGDQSSSGSP